MPEEITHSTNEWVMNKVFCNNIYFIDDKMNKIKIF